MKQAKSKRSPKRPKSHLSPREEELSTTPPSLGYHSDGCEESEDECVEAVEDAAALEDEGVTGLPGNKLVRCMIIIRSSYANFANFHYNSIVRVLYLHSVSLTIVLKLHVV